MAEFRMGDKPRRSSGSRDRSSSRDSPKRFDSSRREDRRSGFREFDAGAPRRGFKAICAKCKQECDLPFEPRGSKPVYCRDCFRSEDSGSDRPSRSSSGDSSEIHRKLDKIMKALHIDEE